MKAFREQASAVLCPSCSYLMPRTDHLNPADDRVTVVCVNMNCNENGKKKTYPRPSVELTDAPW